MTRRIARERPTILQIIPRLDTGGAELSTVEIAAAIVQAGGRALVLTEGGRLAERITAEGGEIITFPAASKNPFRMLANAATMARIARSESVDLLHARSRAPAWSALLAARRTGRPLVTTYHGAYAERGRMKRLYNSVMARADHVIANSEFTGALIRQRYGTPAERVTVIHRGVDLAAFDPAGVPDARVAAIRRQWGVPDGRRILLQAARLTGWKGQRITIEAVGRLHRQGRLGAVAVVLAGDAQGRDGYAEMLRRTARELGIEDIIHFPGHVSDMATAFRAAHAGIIASTEPEAFGRTATEAQAMGCPVVATDIGAPRETVVTGSQPGTIATGWLVQPGSAADLAEGIAAALRLTPEAREAMGEAARRNVQSRFTLAAMKRDTLAVYDALLGTGLVDRFVAATAPPGSKDG